VSPDCDRNDAKGADPGGAVGRGRRTGEGAWRQPGRTGASLEFKHLKRVTETEPRNDGRQAKPSFVEVIAPSTSAGRECIVELEGPRGKLRIELKDRATAEVAAISRALWEMLV